MVIQPASIAQITNLQPHIFIDFSSTFVRSILLDRLLHRSWIHNLEAKHGDPHLFTKFRVLLRLHHTTHFLGLHANLLTVFELAPVVQEIAQELLFLLVPLNVVRVRIQIFVCAFLQLLLQVPLGLRVESLDSFRAQICSRHVSELGLGEVARFLLELVELAVQLLHLRRGQLFKPPLEQLASVGFAAPRFLSLPEGGGSS